jgi:hypothetical protein
LKFLYGKDSYSLKKRKRENISFLILRREKLAEAQVVMIRIKQFSSFGYPD